MTSAAYAQRSPYRINFKEGGFEGKKQLAGELDSLSFALLLNDIRNQLFSAGHLLANIDRLAQGDSLLAEIYVGPTYYWHSLGTENIPQEYLSRSGYRPKEFQNREVSPKQFRKLAGDIISEATNNGYPFARLELADVEVLKGSIKGVLDYQPGPVIKYDTLTVKPETIVKIRYLESYLNIRRDDLFSIDDVRNIKSAVGRLPYVRITDSVVIKFDNNRCNVFFGLGKRKASRFDAIIGFLPNQGKDNGIRITGYADLHLENLFNAGKSLTFQWQQFQPLSQKLFLKYNHPNLFRSNIGLGLKADLIKQDSLFLNTDISFDIFYAKNDLELGFVSDIISARQLSTPQDTTRIPLIGDYNMNLFGLTLNYDRLGDRKNPRSGYRVLADFKIGGKNIRKNASISESAYDSIKLNTTQIQFGLNSAFNKPIGRSFVFHTTLSGGVVLNNDRLFVNDLLRVGGVNSLRGFNEFELYVSSFTLARLEMRLLMNEASRVFLFYDQAYTFNELVNNSDFPLGFGAGIYLGTGAGDLQLIYALGVSQEQSLSLDQSKIHIGYVANF